MAREDVVVIGAGPAGLTAAAELVAAGVPTIVVEADTVVGGISRTVEREGWRFDIGGHRFFTKVERVAAFWRSILDDDEFLVRPRRSRILYRGRFFAYPLRPGDALRNLGIIEALRCVASYLWARVRPPADQTNLEGWISARFGSRLYQHFFKSYNEKVWGIPAAAMPADWAAQRIKNLSLAAAVQRALLPGRSSTEVVSLIEHFHYPRLGPGQMWEAMAGEVAAAGGDHDAITRLAPPFGVVLEERRRGVRDDGQDSGIAIGGHRYVLDEAAHRRRRRVESDGLDYHLVGADPVVGVSAHGELRSEEDGGQHHRLVVVEPRRESGFVGRYQADGDVPNPAAVNDHAESALGIECHLVLAPDARQ